MSYLVDALKKAERERRASDTSDLNHAASMDAPRRRGPGIGRWVLAALVAMNVALVIYIWRPEIVPAGTTDALALESRPVAQEQVATGPVSSENARADDTGSAPRMPETPIVRQTVAPAPSTNTNTAGGRVTYSNVPLTDDAGADTPSQRPETTPTTANADVVAESAVTDSDASESNLLSQSDTSAPAVTINGQLYSTVPGRSFILVGGRRYHEGERLTAGPAVEQIEPDGAVLRFKGQRYRVAGPG